MILLNCSKRIIAALVSGSLLVTLCACSSGTEENDSATAAESQTVTESAAEASLPKVDYEGYNFRILAYDNAYVEQWAAELNGEAVNDAVYERNAAVSEKYDIALTVNQMGDADYRAAVSRYIDAGEDAYDLYYIFLSAAATSFVPKGCFVDWNEVPYVSENLGENWWNQSGLSALKVNGKNYLLNGDIGHLTLGNATGLFFNKALFDDRGLAYPYEAVLDGSWTLDSLLNLVNDGSYDLDGDGKLSVDSDFYSFMSTKWVAPVGLAVACDLKTLVYDENGYPTLNFLTEKTVGVYNKLYRLICGNDIPLGEYNADLPSTDAYRLFHEDRALIIAAGLQTSSVLRDMDSDFGIIPYPKYDEAQVNYMSSIDAGSMTTAVAITSPDLERTGLLTEALCEEGSARVIPAFYDVTLQGKTSRDDASSGMLDIIKDSACFDPLYVYNFGGLGFAFINWLGSGKQDIAGEYAKLESKANAEIESLWSQIDN